MVTRGGFGGASAMLSIYPDIYYLSIVSRPCLLAGYRKNNIIDAVLHTLSVAVAVCDTSQQQPADADQYKWFSSAIEFLIG